MSLTSLLHLHAEIFQLLSSVVENEPFTNSGFMTMIHDFVDANLSHIS